MQRNSPFRVLITAGPTHEPIDAVRYIANRSSGRLGIAICEAAFSRNLPTTLLLGPTHLEPRKSSQMRLHRFRTTSNLQSLLQEQWPHHDVLIMAAAVADYRPAKPALPGSKMQRGRGPLTLELAPTPDLLAELAASTRPDQRIIAFALEPQDQLLESARAKLLRKGADAIVANPLETMDAETISAALIWRGGRTDTAPPGMTKTAFAEWLLDRITA